MSLRRIFACFLVAIALFALPCHAAGEPRYYMGDVPLNAATDSGFSGTDPIDQNDLHFGWTLGRFYVTGYTRGPDSIEGEYPIFLKNAGDTVTLWFRLEQPLDGVNGDELMTIADDDSGCDVFFGIPQTDFGRGTLIIRHTDYENHHGDPIIYTDYLSGLESGAETQVQLFEEGDYEVALNYTVQRSRLTMFDTEIFPQVEDYRIYFRFSVRNGNCMAFPFDAVTGAELRNASSTTGGFYLDLAKSRYLDIQVKRSIMTETAEGWTEDIRFNRPAKDGEQYTEEGIYTITVRNRYTYEETVKTIYVGTDPLMQAHATTGLPLEELAMELSAGAVINPDGTLTPAPPQPEIPLPLIGIGAAVLAAVIGIFLLVRAIRRRSERSLLDFDGQHWWG